MNKPDVNVFNIEKLLGDAPKNRGSSITVKVTDLNGVLVERAVFYDKEGAAFFINSYIELGMKYRYEIMEMVWNTYNLEV